MNFVVLQSLSAPADQPRSMRWETSGLILGPLMSSVNAGTPQAISSTAAEHAMNSRRHRSAGISYFADSSRLSAIA